MKVNMTGIGRFDMIMNIGELKEAIKNKFPYIDLDNLSITDIDMDYPDIKITLE